MIIHARTLIRNAVALALTNASAITQTVYPSRVHSIKPDSLLVYTVEETSERHAMGPNGGTLRRELTIQIVGNVASSDGFDDDADALAAAVEQTIGGDPELGGLTIELFLNTTEIELIGEAEKPIGTVTMEFVAHYITAAANASITL